MKKVLIFGLGFQGKKYVSYFKKSGFIIDGVTKSGLNKKNLLGLNNIFSFDEMKKDKEDFFHIYDLIIIVVKPYSEQDYVIKYLLSLNINNKIIIEKPVTQNLELLNKLLYKDNYFFFIDELFLGNLFRYKKISDLYLNIPNGDSEIFEHAMAFFLLNEGFKNILDLLKIKTYDCSDYETLNYSIKSGNYMIICFKGNYYINNKKIGKIFFSKTLEYLLNIKKEDNYIYKENFYLLEKYIKNAIYKFKKL